MNGKYKANMDLVLQKQIPFLRSFLASKFATAVFYFIFTFVFFVETTRNLPLLLSEE